MGNRVRLSGGPFRTSHVNNASLSETFGTCVRGPSRGGKKNFFGQRRQDRGQPIKRLLFDPRRDLAVEKRRSDSTRSIPCSKKLSAGLDGFGDGRKCGAERVR